jgi:hypothetical protein
VHLCFERLAEDFQKNRPERIDMNPVHAMDILDQHGLHVGTCLFPNVEIMLRKPLGSSEQMLALFVAFRAWEQLADRDERRLDIDVAEKGQDIGDDLDDPFDRDSIDVAERRLDRTRFRQPRRPDRRDKLTPDLWIDTLKIVVVRQNIVAKPFEQFVTRVVVGALGERLQRTAVKQLLAAQEPLVVVERLLELIARGQQVGFHNVL